LHFAVELIYGANMNRGKRKNLPLLLILNTKLKLLSQIAGGQLSGNGEVEISAAAPIETAQSGQITFVANPKYAKFLESTSASAVVLSPEVKFDRLPSIRHQNPYLAFAIILDHLYPEPERAEFGIHASSVVSESAILGQNTSIGALSFIGNNSSIGDNTKVLPKAYIGNCVSLGSNCKIYPGVHILDDTKIGNNVIIHSGTVIGSDGFGYARHDKGIKKVKQIGWVEIGDDTEIGANCTIDRGALGPTKIGRCVKIDNLVQIAHNVEIGDYSIIVSQVGISGSTKLGKGVILAGQVGLTGHIELGDGVTVGAQSGVKNNIPAGKTYFGYPAREIMETKRIEACLGRLPELFKRVKKLEDK
jgi:UDP-3-O-[3-hydroxymyristoyl] glucosamine N-acyltransferase